jgi:hypothetical protein
MACKVCFLISNLRRFEQNPVSYLNERRITRRMRLLAAHIDHRGTASGTGMRHTLSFSAPILIDTSSDLRAADLRLERRCTRSGVLLIIIASVDLKYVNLEDFQ